jgi:hypothetical protein
MYRRQWSAESFLALARAQNAVSGWSSNFVVIPASSSGTARIPAIAAEI